MATNINALNRALPIEERTPKIAEPKSGNAAEGPNFGEVLTDALAEAGKSQATADETTQSFMRGEASIHQVMIAGEKAGISLRYAVTLKNKALEAYRELMNTPI